MTKKLRSWRALFCTLAVLATISFIVACGEGQPVDIGMGLIEGEIDSAERIFVTSHLTDVINDVERNLSSSSEAPSSSSSSEKDDDKESSSSEASSTKSSSSEKSSPSSSSEPPKSSSSNPYTLACNVINSPLTITDPKSMPYTSAEIAKIIKIDCKYKNESKDINAVADVKWEDSPNWNGAAAGTWSSIKITIYPDVEACRNMNATCTGTIKISGSTTPSSNSTTPSSNSSGGTSSSSRATSSNSNTPSSSSTGSSTFEDCKKNGTVAYCDWGTSSQKDCSVINTQWGAMGESGKETCKGPDKPCACSDLITNCETYSNGKKVYSDAQCNTPIGGGTTSSASGGGSSSASGGGSCTAVSKNVDFNSTSGSCYNYTADTDYDCTIKAYTQTAIELKVTCSNSTTSTKTTKANDWTDFVSCPKKTVTKIEASGATKMHMNCW
jgi:hypothetical protein